MKKSDPVYDLAENIVNSINRISSAKVQKAGFDQTYKTTIIGINRIFVDTVPVSKQNEIIRDYNIPEDDSNLDYSFYTVILEGVYYIVKSANNFALYEEVIVRIPNNDWSNVFIESLKDDAESGVGEWLDPEHTTEIFNCYKNTRWGDSRNSSVMKYDHVEGCGNIIEAEGDIWQYSGYNHFQGYNNKGFMTFYSFVGGSGNTLGTKPAQSESYGNWNIDSFVYGHGNTADHIQNTVILGSQNSGTNLSSCFMSGSSNSMSNSQYSAAIGDWLTVTNGNGCLALGTGTIDARNLILALVGGIAGKLFTVSDSGDVEAYGTVTASQFITRGADNAEYFEWADGNPDDEDRMGMLVNQKIGDKIAPAQGTEFFGAISARASVVGNAYEDYWHGKYITDVYGRIQYDKDGHALISPDYDPSRVYVPRSQRPEWAVTGLTGRIIVRDDGSCFPGGYVSARQGVATSCYSRTAGCVLRRIDDRHIEILLK